MTKALLQWTFSMSSDGSIHQDKTFCQDWIEGNQWNPRSPPPTLEEKLPRSNQPLHNNNHTRKIDKEDASPKPKLEQKITIEREQATNDIVQKLNPKAKNRLEARTQQEEAVEAELTWKTFALPPWVPQPESIPAKWRPVRIGLTDTSHSWLRSIAWVLDLSFRYQSRQSWTVSRIEWTKQIANDLENTYYKYYQDVSLLSLQQSILRSQTDWEKIVGDALSSPEENASPPPIIQVLLDWCQVQCWIWNEDTQSIHRWYGRQYQNHPEHQASLPVIMVWWSGSYYQPVLWLDGIPAQPKADTLRPLPFAWVQPWKELWFMEEPTDELEEEQEPEEPEEPEPKAPAQTIVVVPPEIKKYTKPYWQFVMKKLGLEFKKKSPKTGKMIDKTIDEMRQDCESIGYSAD
jgi:hypothetical protein